MRMPSGFNTRLNSWTALQPEPEPQPSGLSTQAFDAGLHIGLHTQFTFLSYIHAWHRGHSNHLPAFYCTIVIHHGYSSMHVSVPLSIWKQEKA